MGVIYRGSLCTIMALQSANPEGGCFAIRNPLQNRPCHLSKLSSICIGNVASMQPPTGALLRRGWVVQERVLSSRTLYYDADQILWGCVASNADESFPMMTGAMTNPKKSFVSLPVLMNLPKRPPRTFTLVDGWEFYDSWIGLLSYYTSCQLTRASDRLVASQGMIAIIRQATSLHSIAGLWREMIARELLWFTCAGQPHASGSLRLPTWSWMSVDSRVDNNTVNLVTRGYRLSFELSLHRSTQKMKETKMGQLWLANLYVMAAMEPFSEACQTSIACRGRAAFSENSEDTTIDIGDEQRDQRQSFWCLDREEPIEQDLFAVLVVRGKSAQSLPNTNRLDPGSCICDMGIVVTKFDRGTFGTWSYRRVGYFEQHYRSRDTHPIFSSVLKPVSLTLT